MDSDAELDDLSTVHARLPSTEREVAGSVRLTVEDGPDRGTQFSFGEAGLGSVLIGQSPTCALRLTDKRVSRRHAVIAMEGARIRITDLDSSNGTYVDGVQILGAMLRGGETVRLGDTAIRVIADEDSIDVAPAKIDHFGKLLGGSLEMRRCYAMAQRFAPTDLPILLEGETGTGKEVMAEAIHEESRRAQRPYVVLDCTAIAPNLIEAELFGHERGAFTGATSLRKGVFELADGGTLFIDEIGDLEFSLQAKLLRAIERGELKRVGSGVPIRVDVRIIVATRRNLDREVTEGRFRDDLLHRLAVCRIEMPPLRQRKGDVNLLARAFWNELGGRGRPLTQTMMRKWEDGAWPGNVRELRNAVVRQLALSAEPMVASSAVASEGVRIGTLFEEILSAAHPFPVARDKVMHLFEQAYVEGVLAAHGGHVEKAANASGIARRYFQIIKARSNR